MEYLFLGMAFLVNFLSAFWVAHIGACRGVRWAYAFWSTFLLGPVVGLLYVLVKSLTPRCGAKCDC